MANKKTETRKEVDGKVAITKGMAKAGKLAGKAVNVPALGNKQGLTGSNRTLKKAIAKTVPKSPIRSRGGGFRGGGGLNINDVNK